MTIPKYEPEYGTMKQSGVGQYVKLSDYNDLLEVLKVYREQKNIEIEQLKKELAIATDLIDRMRAQWIHSWAKDECLELLEKAKGVNAN